ncbi:two-component system sensor histidine kinase NtrB [Cohnella caldifontis]|uniref:two-component system sensor histidine kinase NtrB n=1 Tax=Cohnella caldifontis TaxID=3027471 RepID=UPI0023EC33C7|nr:ATP-binding protein [Cohnella sp. YIM B05605]
MIGLAFERVKLQGQLREMSQKYRAEAERLQLFIDQAPLAVIFADADGFITHINDVCDQYLQTTGRGSMIGRHCSELFEEPGSEAASIFERVRTRKEPVTEIMRARGKTFYTVAAPFQGTPKGYLFLGHDMTELQALRDELGRMERLSLVGQMAASITHEIRNPMAVIRGFIQLLNERSPAEQQSYFRIVMEELDRTNGIINDFLSLAQNRIVEKRLCSLHDVLHEVEPLIRADANMRGQQVELRLCGEMEPLELNGKEIKQLLLNLARNGMEAMESGGVLTIETDNFEDFARLRVSDRGVGIPPEQVARMFEPFYTTKTNGTGLGLALCLSIVERHNGKIDVESTVGRGTTFIVSFCKPGREWEKNARSPDRGSAAWQG